MKLFYRVLPQGEVKEIAPALAAILERRFGIKHILRAKDVAYLHGVQDSGIDCSSLISALNFDGDILIFPESEKEKYG